MRITRGSSDGWKSTLQDEAVYGSSSDNYIVAKVNQRPSRSAMSSAALTKNYKVAMKIGSDTAGMDETFGMVNVDAVLMRTRDVVVWE